MMVIKGGGKYLRDIVKGNEACEDICHIARFLFPFPSIVNEKYDITAINAK